MKEEYTKVNLAEIVDSKSAFRSDGEKLRHYFEKHWNHTKAFCINFKELKGASPSFLDEAFAKLFLTYEIKEVVGKLKFSSLGEYHRNNLNELVELRLRQKQRVQEPV